MVTLLVLAACAPDTAPSTPVPLDALSLLSRISLDLRGRRPSEDELVSVEADPARVDELVEDYLRDPAFGDRVFWLYADLYKTRVDQFTVGVDGEPQFLDVGERARFTHAVGDEPLRLLARVATDDLPWTEIVTADWTMADDQLLASFPLEAIEDGEGWRKARYTDARPAAGVLTTNGLWWRYTSTLENVNRGRAEAISRLLACDARFDQPVAFSEVSATMEEMQDRARNDEACVSCHGVIDPVGSYLFGFSRVHLESYAEARWYYPNRELDWQTVTGVAPAWYGTPGDDLFDLGDQIAADPRFVSCAVEQAFGFFLGAPPTFDDTERLHRMRSAFLEGGLTLRSLFRAAVADEGYRSADPSVPGTLPVRRMTPSQLSTAVEALTGFAWTYEDLDMLTEDAFGVRVLAGGSDGMIVTEPATDHAASQALVAERLAEAAATYAVTRESALEPGERVLFREVDDLHAVPARDAVLTQVRALVLRVHGRRIAESDDEARGLADLWEELYATTGDPATAWALLASGLLRHPDFLHY